MRIFTVVEVHVYHDTEEYYVCSWTFTDRDAAMAAIDEYLEERVADWMQAHTVWHEVSYDTEEYDVEAKCPGEFHGWRIEEQDLEV